MNFEIDIDGTEIQAIDRSAPPEGWRDGIVHGDIPDGETPNDGPIVIFSQIAMRHIVKHSRSDMRVELGGLLLGHVYESEADGQPFVDILAALPIRSDENGPIHFTFTADSWALAHDEREEKYPNLSIVGWYHTHPDLSVFFSADDEVVHATAFTMPWQVGLVVDPVRDEAYLFGWKHGQISPLAGFVELPDKQTQSVVRWRYEFNRYWASLPIMNYAQAEDSPILFSDLFMGHAMTATLTLIGAFIVGILGLIPLNRQLNQLEDHNRVLVMNAQTELGSADCAVPGVFFDAEVDRSSVELWGLAELDGFRRYSVQARPAGSEGDWVTADGWTNRSRSGELSTIDLSSFGSGPVDIRLIPVASGGIPDFDLMCQRTVSLP